MPKRRDSTKCIEWDECSRMTTAWHGYCPLHKGRLNRTGSVRRTRYKSLTGICSAEGCDEKHVTGGWCQMHARRVSATGDPGPAGRIRYRSLTGLCEIVDCGRRHSSQGLCAVHKTRFDLTGIRGGPIKARRSAGVVSRTYRDKWLWSRYHVTEADLFMLLAQQDGLCALCGTSEPKGRGMWHVDHDHAHCAGNKSCGECIRGLLCNRCNLALGHFKDDVQRIWNAISYLVLPPVELDWLTAPPERKTSRQRSLWKRNRLSEDQYFEILHGQDGGCAICHSDEPGSRGVFYVDHDHNRSCCSRRDKSCSECFRGLLCHNCNVGIGAFQDDPALLSKAIQYLNIAEWIDFDVCRELAAA